MVEEILPSLFKIEVPLPRNPLKALNCYVLMDRGRNLIVDTGMNREECRSALFAGLAELGVDLRATDLFVTHMHADHSGLVGEVAVEGTRVYCSQIDGGIVRGGSPWDEMRDQARLHGFPEEETRAAIERHPAYRYGASARAAHYVTVREGDEIAAGDYSFRCIETPGHTRGHLCLYEADRKILISGDHILRDITPNISLWFGEEDALKEYLESLDKVSLLDVGLVLPGHRRIITDCKGRIEELKRHHRVRADEALSILDGGATDAYRVASRITSICARRTRSQSTRPPGRACRASRRLRQNPYWAGRLANGRPWRSLRRPERHSESGRRRRSPSVRLRQLRQKRWYWLDEVWRSQ